MKKNLAKFFAQLIIEKNPSFNEFDRLYLINRIYALTGEKNQYISTENVLNDPLAIRDKLIKVAIKNQKIKNDITGKDILGSQLMSLSVPYPSKINETFWRKYKLSPNTATNYFYRLSKDSDYIKTRAIAKNIVYNTKTKYGDIEITINLSKPEKDPKAIAAAGKNKSTSYPLCQLCMENEGYLGHLGYPARSEHRIVKFNLNGEEWGFQYSPYAYFKEHCIFMSLIHRPMHIDRPTFDNLLKLVSMFPEYTVGSNADLPIVGGSMLSHDHYQGGRHDFPMAKAKIEEPITLNKYPHLKAGIVNWPMSVIRLISQNKNKLIDASVYILDLWKNYSDESVDIRAQTNGERHHTITPIARKRNGNFEMDLVLRDNQTSKKYPDGIFHPHKDVQHIKKENIGLIEVMGRAILPARLKTELREVEKFILNKENNIAAIHLPWAKEIKKQFTGNNEDDARKFVQKKAGQVFAECLEYAGVFKHDEKGRQAFRKFINKL